VFFYILLGVFCDYVVCMCYIVGKKKSFMLLLSMLKIVVLLNFSVSMLKIVVLLNFSVDFVRIC